MEERKNEGGGRGSPRLALRPPLVAYPSPLGFLLSLPSVFFHSLGDRRRLLFLRSAPPPRQRASSCPRTARIPPAASSAGSRTMAPSGRTTPSTGSNRRDSLSSNPSQTANGTSVKVGASQSARPSRVEAALTLFSLPNNSPPHPTLLRTGPCSERSPAPPTHCRIPSQRHNSPSRPGRGRYPAWRQQALYLRSCHRSQRGSGCRIRGGRNPRRILPPGL